MDVRIQYKLMLTFGLLLISHYIILFEMVGMAWLSFKVINHFST